MRVISSAVVALSIGLTLTGVGEAKGCLKGAAVGAVAGHVAGHHAVVGAAAGCVIEHHREKVRDRAVEHPNPAAPAAPPQSTPAAPTAV